MTSTETDAAAATASWRGLTIFERMHGILADVGAISKTQTNESFDYKFRGIDDVMNALHPLFAKWGVVMAPEILTRDERLYQTRNGAAMLAAVLTVRFTFHGVAGDSIGAVGVGEGNDSSDKASSKAWQAALKYVLLHTFLIPTGDMAESDNESPEQGRPVEPAAPAVDPTEKGFRDHEHAKATADDFRARLEALDEDDADAIKAWIREREFEWPYTLDQFIEIHYAFEIVDDQGAEDLSTFTVHDLIAKANAKAEEPFE